MIDSYIRTWIDNPKYSQEIHNYEDILWCIDINKAKEILSKKKQKLDSLFSTPTDD